MAQIVRAELNRVNLVPKVRRTDAIQSFVSQETPLLTLTDSDGAQGTGYTYTIGSGGLRFHAQSVTRLLLDGCALQQRLVLQLYKYGTDPRYLRTVSRFAG